MPIILRRSRPWLLPFAATTARFSLNPNDVRYVKALAKPTVPVIVMPPLPPRPAFFRPQVPSGLSAERVALRLGLVRKIDRQTGRMHFERRQIKSLMRRKSGVGTVIDLNDTEKVLPRKISQPEADMRAAREAWARER